MKIGLVSCGSAKREVISRAATLYTGTYFKLAYAAAKRTCDKVYILSAKYGLIEEEKVIAPYDATLLKMSLSEKIKWAEQIYSELRTKLFKNDEIIFFSGKIYAEHLQPLLSAGGWKTIRPAENCRGIGYAVQFYKRMAET